MLSIFSTEGIWEFGLSLPWLLLHISREVTLSWNPPFLLNLSHFKAEVFSVSDEDIYVLTYVRIRMFGRMEVECRQTVFEVSGCKHNNTTTIMSLYHTLRWEALTWTLYKKKPAFITKWHKQKLPSWPMWCNFVMVREYVNDKWHWRITFFSVLCLLNSPFALRHNDNHLDLPGSGDQPSHSPDYYHLQKTARGVLWLVHLYCVSSFLTFVSFVVHLYGSD